MNIQLLSVLFLFESFFSCGLGQEKSPLSEANLAPQSKASCQQVEQSGVVASNIVFQSNDLGKTWQDVSAGLPATLSVGRVVADGSEIILASGNKLFRSNTGATTPVWNNQDVQNLDPIHKIDITNLFLGKTGLFAASYEEGFFKEIPGAGFWLPLHQALNDKRVRCVLELSNGTLLVGVESGLFKSVDSGATWKLVVKDMGINTLIAANAEESVLICGTYEGLHRSIDGGEHWDLVLTEDAGAWNAKRIEGGVITITEGGSWKDSARNNRLRFSSDNGKTWLRLGEGFDQNPFMYNADENAPSVRRIYGIAQLGKYLFCSTNSGVFRSDNLGKSWEIMRLTDGKETFELVVSGNAIYAIQVVGC